MRDDKRILLDVLKAEGTLKTPEVIRAFGKVPREDFVLQGYAKHAYDDIALPIISGQTISQPSTVVIMTEILDAHEGHKVFEVGTGSGYQAAILSEIVGKKGRIITTEIASDIYEFGKKNLKKYKNVDVLLHDGSGGYETESPYDRIIITAATPEIPAVLKKQLKVGGKLVAPVGRTDLQEMTLVEKVSETKYKTSYHGEFVFVPMRHDKI